MSAPRIVFRRSSTLTGFETHVAESIASGAATKTLTLTRSTVTTPDDPALSLLSVKTVDASGTPQVGINVTATIIAVPDNGTGLAYLGATQTVPSSDPEAVATLTVVRGARYCLSRDGGQNSIEVDIPDASTCTVPSFIGSA